MPVQNAVPEGKAHHDRAPPGRPYVRGRPANLSNWADIASDRELDEVPPGQPAVDPLDLMDQLVGCLSGMQYLRESSSGQSTTTCSTWTTTVTGQPYTWTTIVPG